MVMNSSQVRWAQSHDWFINDNGDGSVVVEDFATCDDVGVLVGEDYSVWAKDGGGWAGSKCVVFDSYRVLREWAGY